MQIHSDCPEGARFQQWRLDRLVGRMLAEAFALTSPALPAPKSAHRRRAGGKTNSKDSLETALAALSARRQNCLDMFERGLLKSMDELASRVAAIDAEEARLRRALPQEAEEQDAVPALRVSAAEWQRLQTAFGRVYQPVTVEDLQAPGYRDIALDGNKHDLLKSLGVMLYVRLPKLPPEYKRPSAARRAEERGSRVRQLGAGLVLTADVGALGLIGPHALSLSETDADSADYRAWVAWARRQKIHQKTAP